MSEKKKPERIFRIGDVSCSVFLQNAGEDRTFRTVNLQKSYLDRENERQYSGSLSLAELPTAIEVLRMALNYVAGEEAFVAWTRQSQGAVGRLPAAFFKSAEEK